MKDFLFKTRGDSSPDRKQKVFFCAHPADYHYLDSIAAEILEYQNCAVWYDSDPEGEFDEKEFTARLAEMQLFVMPVTRRLLTTPNRAMALEFAIAMEKHIPVLPLMQEEGLDELFSEKCGDRQYLNKYSRDTTGISYEEKLEKYLAAVLVGDEEAKKIREAFAAYIFLSYRKKDREHAQKLMRLIHKIDFCRDVAIWYDEFLTIGEDFKKNIEEAFDKSDLFVLAVTPNLLEQDNYVMRIEYPMARKSGKPILPAQLIETKESSLREGYADIPKCVDVYDRIALYGALREHFGRLEPSDDPKQLYLMGLAYLNGVDVEKDSERALELITASAQKEHIDALEKLVQMYRTGVGARQDYSAGVEWQQRLVDVRKRLYEQSGREDDAYMYFNALWNLGNYTLELRRMGDARAIYECMEQVSHEFSEKFHAQWARRNLAVSYEKLGDIYLEISKLQLARAYYEQSLEIALAIAHNDSSIRARRDLAVSYNKLGDICKAMDEPQLACKYYEQGLEIALAIAQEDSSIQVWCDLATYYDRLGNICRTMSKPQLAQEYYKQSLDITLKIAQEDSGILVQRNLAICYERLGDICSENGDGQKVCEYYEQSFDIRIAIAQKDSSIQARRDLAASYIRLGDICSDMDEPQKACEYYEHSLEISLTIAQEDRSIQAQRDLSIDHERLGDIYMTMGKLQKAHEYYEQSLEIRLAIAQEDSSIRARSDLAISYNRLGDICSAMCEPQKAREYYEHSLEIALAIAQQTGTVESLDDLAGSYYKIGTTCYDPNMLRRAYDICVELSKKCPNVSKFAQRRDALKPILLFFDRLFPTTES